MICRLQGVGPKGANVIAKKCRAATALTERTIYQEILPQLPLDALQCYGYLEDDNSEFHWLFLEDAGTNPYVPAVAEHRDLFCHWLAVLHGMGQKVPAASRLPQRGANHFLEHLRLGRDRIERNLGNAALTAADCALLERIVTQCDSVEAQWATVEDSCKWMPQTFVHCDLKRANMRVRATANGPALVCFDWETAGWGLIGADLVKCPDLLQYAAVARESWPELGESEIARIFKVGTLLRLLAETHWETSHLQFQWLERPRLSLQACHDKLATAMTELGIN
jgi:hypothetical protein